MTNLQEAVELVLAGDVSAFQRIVDATSARLVRVSARVLGNLADAEDVVQEAYVKAYRALVSGKFDGRSTLETWLYRIVIHGSIDAKRSRARKIDRIGATEPEPKADGEAMTEAHLALMELEAWMGDLPKDQRAVLVLKAMEGWSSAEIAQLLGCSEGAVEQKLVRARQALRQRGGHSGDRSSS